MSMGASLGRQIWSPNFWLSSLVTMSVGFVIGWLSRPITTSRLHTYSGDSSFGSAGSSELESDEIIDDLGEKFPQNEFKMVLVVRTDLSMGKGKIAAQCSHAAVDCYKKALKKQPRSLQKWERNACPKITLRAEGDAEFLYTLSAMATSLDLISTVIHDAGRTQIAAGSATVLGIGPGPATLINQVTGQLKLF